MKVTNVDVGKLGDAKALEGFGQTRQSDAPVSNFHIKPAVEKPVSRRREWRGAYRNRHLPEKVPAVRREQDDGIRLGSCGMTCRATVHVAVDPSCDTRSSVYRPENHHQAETQPRPHYPHRKGPIN